MISNIRNEIKFKAMREIEGRRRNAELLNERAEKLLSSLPEYNELIAERGRQMLAFSNALAENDVKSAENFNKKLDDICDKINELALKNNLHLENWYCVKCHDTGRLENGEYCECYNRLEIDYYREEMGLNKLPTITFSDHKQGLNDTLDKLYQGMENYVASFPNNKKRKLIFSGSVGVGKTYLVAAVANEIIKKGYKVMYISAIDLAQLFLNYHMASVNEKDLLFAPLKSADMLIIDDLGVEPIYNSITIPYLYQILELRGMRHMIITTNLTLEDIETRYGERIYSRIVDVDNSMMLRLSGDDLRLKKK